MEGFRHLTIPDHQSVNSVEVGSMFVPARSIEKTLSQFTSNLMVANDNDDFKLSLVGSATGIRFRDREILLTTQHQLQGVDETRVAMLTDAGSHLITSCGCRRINANSDTDAYDIAAFDFTEPSCEWPELKKRFFNFAKAPPDTLNVNILAILLVGFPSVDQVYEVHENSRLGLCRRSIACLPHSQPSDEVLLSVKPFENLTFDPDGMSGGAAFAVQMVDNQPEANFAGIVLRGGKNAFQILKSGYILVFLGSIFQA